MPTRRLPVRPNLEQLKHQAKDLLRAVHARDAEAVRELRAHHPQGSTIDPASAKLADAQLALARAYGASSWPRLVQACELTDAIWRDDVDALVAIVTKNPELLHEHATIRDSNWGPPMAYAANLGRDRIVAMFKKLGARDTEWALGRAVLQGKISTAKMLYEMLGEPRARVGGLAGPAYTLSVSGTAFVFEMGGRVVDDRGRPDAGTMEHLLGTDSRNPPAKHEILRMYVEHGLQMPDTPICAIHRGRIDLLERLVERDPSVLTRTYTTDDVFPPELGCGAFQPWIAQGTPLGRCTLLHVCAYFDEIEIAEWLLDRGMPVDARPTPDGDGFGGHTALFNALVGQPNFWVNYGKGKPDEARFTRLLLERGANPNVRASLKAGLEEGHGGGGVKEYRDVTPLSWAERYPAQIFVSKEAVRLVREAGGTA
jgi:hypothetical protein